MLVLPSSASKVSPSGLESGQQDGEQKAQAANKLEAIKRHYQSSWEDKWDWGAYWSESTNDTVTSMDNHEKEKNHGFRIHFLPTADISLPYQCKKAHRGMITVVYSPSPLPMKPGGVGTLVEYWWGHGWIKHEHFYSVMSVCYQGDEFLNMRVSHST